MDYFENIVKRLIEEDGYWVRQSFKVNLTKAEKRSIGRHTMPRPEIDLLGFRPRSNELLVIEAKSFIDSLGVRLEDLKQTHDIPQGRFKLFTCENYRHIVIQRLILDLRELGLIAEEPNTSFGLAAGKIYRDQDEIKKFFHERGWVLYTPSNIAKRIQKLAGIPYDNDPYVIAAKLLLRNLHKYSAEPK